ncbi:MAG: HD domain-containing protein [Spirochaetes bacterium]|nr:HD domain-containing protein [Spirochaetota bacterium]
MLIDSYKIKTDNEFLKDFFKKKVSIFFKFICKYFQKRKDLIVNLNKYNNQNLGFNYFVNFISKSSFLFYEVINKTFSFYFKFNIPINIINHSIQVSLNSYLILLQGILTYNFIYSYNSNKNYNFSKTYISNKKVYELVFNFVKIDINNDKIDKINNYKKFFENLFLKIVQNRNEVFLFLRKFFCAGLLHDIAKYIEIKDRNENHAEKGYQLLKELGLNFEARISKEHLVKDFEIGNISIPSKIINLSDKMVKHSKIVTIEERFIDLINRYNDYASKFSNKNLKLYKSFYNIVSVFAILNEKKINKIKKYNNVLFNKIKRIYNEKIIISKINKYLNIF